MEDTNQSTTITPKPNPFTTVTRLSKTLALILLITLPFIGFILGILYQKFVTNSQKVITDSISRNASNISNANKDTSMENIYEVSNELINAPNVQKETQSTKTAVKDINMDVSTWVLYETKFDYAYDEVRNISFKYPKELYLRDSGTINGTIWIQREPLEYKYVQPVNIEISRSQLNGEFSPMQSGVTRSDVEGGVYKIMKAELQYTGVPYVGYGVIYYLGDEWENRDMAIYLSLYSFPEQIPAEDEKILRNITEEIAKSFTFLD